MNLDTVDAHEYEVGDSFPVEGKANNTRLRVPVGRTARGTSVPIKANTRNDKLHLDKKSKPIVLGTAELLCSLGVSPSSL